jgi:hypothetical protein
VYAEAIHNAQEELLTDGHFVQRTWNMEELLTNNLHYGSFYKLWEL